MLQVRSGFAIILLAVATGAGATLAQKEAPTREQLDATIAKRNYSPYAGMEYPTRVLWGDTHLHTSISVDAGAAGCRLGPEDAYRFARGEQITTSTGQFARLSRPLDFLVVADHSEMIGLMPQLLKGDPDILATEKGRSWFELIRKGGDDAMTAVLEITRSLGEKKAPIENRTPVVVAKARRPKYSAKVPAWLMKAVPEADPDQNHRGVGARRRGGDQEQAAADTRLLRRSILSSEGLAFQIESRVLAWSALLFPS